MTHVSQGKFRGNTRENLECGSAQPSLFCYIIGYSVKLGYDRTGDDITDVEMRSLGDIMVLPKQNNTNILKD